MCDLCKVDRKYPCGLIGTDEIAREHYDIQMGRPTDADIERRHAEIRQETVLIREMREMITRRLIWDQYGTTDLLHGKAGMNAGGG